jgi:hypothetical protein
VRFIRLQIAGAPRSGFLRAADYQKLLDACHQRVLRASIGTACKIRKISFMHAGKLLLAEVGKPNPYNNVPVRAIYEDRKRGCYLICAATVTIAPKQSLVEKA